MQIVRGLIPIRVRPIDGFGVEIVIEVDAKTVFWFVVGVVVTMAHYGHLDSLVPW